MKKNVLLLFLGLIAFASCHSSSRDESSSDEKTYPYTGTDEEGRTAEFHLHESRLLTYSIPLGEETKTFYTKDGKSLGEIMDFRPYTDGNRLFFKGLTLDGKTVLYYPEQGWYREFNITCDVYEFFDGFLFYQNGDKMMAVKGPKYHHPLTFCEELTNMAILITFQDGSWPVVVELSHCEWKAHKILGKEVKVIPSKKWDELLENARELPSIGNLRRKEMKTTFF